LEAFSKTVTPAALTALLEHPNHKMQAGGMPATALSAADMSALVAYLQNLGSPVAAAASAASVAATAAPTTAPGAPPTGVTAPATPGQPVAAAPPQGNPDSSSATPRQMNALELDGKLVFDAHSCATCHGVAGARGTWAAPALANTGKNFPTALLTTLLQHPTARMLKGGMPAVSMSPGELNALSAYLNFISAATPVSKPPAR
jgi:mono/diheme cytochrome c family protein